MSAAQRQAFADWLGREMLGEAGEKSAQDKTLETETNP
jgi:hypothetical protein